MTQADTDELLGPPVLLWRDDPLFNQGHVAAELAIAALREIESGEPWDATDAEHAIERLEAFLEAARVEAKRRAEWAARGEADYAALVAAAASGIETEGQDPAEGLGAKHESPTAESGDAQPLEPKD